MGYILMWAQDRRAGEYRLLVTAAMRNGSIYDARPLAELNNVFHAGDVVYALKTKRSHGTFLTVPLEFSVPTLGRIR